MTDNKKISENLKVIVEMTQNGASPPLDQYWDEIVEILSQDIERTSEILLACEPRDIWLMGGYFEDVSARLQSEAFIDLLNELQLKHPEIDIKQDIQWAIEALD